MTTITAAIKTATANHSPLFRFGSCGWKYSRTDGRDWRESNVLGYAQAREVRCISIAEDALNALGFGSARTHDWLADATGSAAQRVRAYLVSHWSIDSDD